LTRKELIYLMAITILILFCNYLIFGLDFLSSGTVFDINVYDTYFVIETKHLFILVSTTLLFIMYLTKVLIFKFRNKFENLILISSNIILITLLSYLASFSSALREIPGTTKYPPLSNIDNVVNEGNIWHHIFPILIWIQLTLIAILVVVSFKTGVNWKSNLKN